MLQWVLKAEGADEQDKVNQMLIKIASSALQILYE